VVSASIGAVSVNTEAISQVEAASALKARHASGHAAWDAEQTAQALSVSGGAEVGSIAAGRQGIFIVLVFIIFIITAFIALPKSPRLPEGVQVSWAS
jgi:hypothetical protein